MGVSEGSVSLIMCSKHDDGLSSLSDESAMLEANLIQPSESPWASLLMLVSKPDGSIRVTIDYTK